MTYQIRPLGKTCHTSGRELQPGETCHSVLIEQAGRLVRLDFSADEWKGPPEDAIGHWTCVVPEPETQRARPLDADALLQDFEQMAEDGNPAQEKLRYVLALLLVQKRKLRIDGSREDGEIQYLQLIGTHGEGPYEAREFELTEDERQQLQQSVNELFNEAPETDSADH